MKMRIENTFGKTMRGVMFAVNPIKKIIVNTHCMAHKYINNKSIELVKKEGYIKEYDFFTRYKYDFNEGVTWADQDFKSSNHFYHFSSGRGLYGFSNALEECEKYYKKANNYLEAGDIKKSVFYFGAACHLIQDATVPQHANKKLLKEHRKFELWIISRIAMGYHFEAKNSIKRYKEIAEYIKGNALMANQIYLKNINIKNVDDRYSKVAQAIIQEAQITTAGIMLDFYEKVENETKM
ncbi:zinc dependent phospholipase C family protein [Clostridium brassicae]|uniref:Phospholipase C n=1 Tax=Clostridium brassicae TaxID=2999072 RepID=A0ABT4DDD6_9CLOT|nr:zinc dependent phospholipase C family protein [Clostridium brassicae]MCY6959029.1 zinc dependent phospholipase C family protein [Clostridium brassicae]